jgi:GT2 family glycosyltransferase
MNITVAIPNYNGLDGLKILLPKITKGDFCGIYLLDDRSTDNSVAYAKTFPQVNVVENAKNLGPGGNRNRILKETRLGDLLWFIDADMDVVTLDIEIVAEKLFRDPNVGMVGGQIISPSGKAMYWNYGYEMHPLRDRLIDYYGSLANRFKENKRIHDLIRKHAIHYFYGLEIEAGNHVERAVEWVAEGNFLVRNDVFRKIEGFDENMRYHECHDIGKRIRKLGMKIIFTPEIVTRHLRIECREGRRPQIWDNGRRYFFNKHWGTPQKAFKNFFRLD